MVPLVLEEVLGFIRSEESSNVGRILQDVQGSHDVPVLYSIRRFQGSLKGY